MSEENKSIGALWKKQSKKGDYFTGQIELDGKKVSIVAFTNDYKKEEKHPDFKIFISKPKEQPNNTDMYNKPEPQHREVNAGTHTEENDDLPF